MRKKPPKPAAPTAKTAPMLGEYTKTPGIEALALSCVALSGVPYESEAGAAQVIVGMDISTVNETVPLDEA